MRTRNENTKKKKNKIKSDSRLSGTYQTSGKYRGKTHTHTHTLAPHDASLLFQAIFLESFS